MNERVTVEVRGPAVTLNFEVARDQLEAFIEGVEQSTDGLIRLNHARMVAGALWPWMPAELHPLPAVRTWP